MQITRNGDRIRVWRIPPTIDAHAERVRRASVEQVALGGFVAELFVCPPSDGRVWIVAGQHLHQIVLAAEQQPFQGCLAGCFMSPCQRRIHDGTRLIFVEDVDDAHGSGHHGGRVARWQRPRVFEDVAG